MTDPEPQTAAGKVLSHFLMSLDGFVAGPNHEMEVSYERRGSGPPVLMIHGLGSRWQLFEPIIDRVAERHEVIAIDLPGFGASPAQPTVSPGPRGYASWLAGWLAEQGIDGPHVVGSSMGGGIALELGRAGAASAVTAFSPVGFYGRAGLWWVQHWLTALHRLGVAAGPVLTRGLETTAVRAALLGTLFGHPTRVPPDVARVHVAGLVGSTAFEAARDDFANYRLTSGRDLGSLARVPVTVAWGTRDVILTHRTQSARARAALPFARHVSLPHCGHLPFSDDPQLCAQLVLDSD